jgi:hypothetical protein
MSNRPMCALTRYHTLSCPTCDRQKLVAVPSTTVFFCCNSFDVVVEAKRTGMLVDVVETWTPKAIAPKRTRLPRGGVDVDSWTVEANTADTFVLVDEYGEPVEDREYTSFKAASEALHQVIVDELAARQDHGPDDC